MEYSNTKRGLLRALSENSRKSVSDLAKQLECSRNTVIANMSILEKELGLKYNLEFDKDVLGIIQKHIVRVKFGIKPETEELRKLFKDDTDAELVAVTEGDFDLLIAVIVDSGEKYAQWGVKTVLKLLPYRPRLKPSLILLPHIGSIPISNDILRKIDLSGLDITDSEKEILLLLNEDARLSMREISRKLGENTETVRYRLRKIIKTGLIRRFTIIVEKPPTDYNIAFFMNFRFAPGIKERYKQAYKYYLEEGSTLPVVNKFPYLSLTSGSYIFFGLGCFESEEQALMETVMKHKEIYKEDRPNITFARITKVVKGSLPIKNLDIKKDFKPVPWD